MSFGGASFRDRVNTYNTSQAGQRNSSNVAYTQIRNGVIYEYDAAGNLIRSYADPNRGPSAAGAASSSSGPSTVGAGGQATGITQTNPQIGGGSPTTQGADGGPVVQTASNPSNPGAPPTSKPDPNGIPATGPFKDIQGDIALQQAWADPEALMRLYAENAGMVGPGGAEVLLQELANSMGILWMIAEDQMKGGVAAPGTREYLNWAGPALNSFYGTPGGSMLSNPSRILETLMNPREQGLKDYLGFGGSAATEGMARSDSVENYLSALQYGLKPGTPPIVLNSILNAVSNAGRGYRAAQLDNPASTQSFNDYMRKNNTMGSRLGYI